MSPSMLAPALPTVAIEIAARRVTVAAVSGTTGRAAVTAFATEPIAPEAVTPALTGPNVVDAAAVTEALRRALDRAGLRSTRRVGLIVPDTIARVSLLPLEQVPSKAAELDQIVRWQVKKATPFPLEEAQISHFEVHADGAARTLAAVVARRDVVAQYEAVTAALGIHAGLVDLASFNIMNALLNSAGAAELGDSLVVCLAAEATTLAILRGRDLMFYRHRAVVDEEPLSALVHQTAMYHEDRLGGARFGHVWLCGASFAAGAADARREIAERLGVTAETVDVRSAAPVRDRIEASPGALDALAAPIGLLLRDRRAA
jgi:Tfp pilus assembly PilM family ATPase